MKRCPPRRIWTLLTLLAVAAPGCAGYVTLDVTSQPAGANVFIGHERLGATPTGVVVVRTSEPRLPVTLEKLGYKPIAVVLTVRPHDSEAAAREKPHRLSLDLVPR